MSTPSSFDAILEHFYSERPGERVLWVQGPRGAGKTAFLERLVAGARRRAVVFEGIATLSGQVIAELLRAAESGSPRFELDDTGDLVDVYERLRQREEPAVVVLDDVDRLDAFDRGMLANTLHLVRTTDRTVWLLSSTDPAPVRSRAIAQMVLEGDEGDRDESGDRPPLSEPELTMDEKRALALLLAAGEPLEQRALDALEIDAALLSKLEGLELLRRQRDRWLIPTQRLFDVKSWIEPPLLRECHEVLVELTRARLAGSSADAMVRSRLTASLIGHLEASGAEEEAAELFLGEQALAEVCPEHWCSVAASLSTLRALAQEPAVLMTAAEILQSAGLAEEALRNIEVLLWRDLDPEELLRAHVIAAASHSSLGRHLEARRDLELAVENAADEEDRARIAELVARALREEGEPLMAIEVAAAVLDECRNAASMAALHEELGLSAARLGQEQRARQHFELALEQYRVVGDVRSEARLLRVVAAAELEAGDVAAAISAHRRGWELAERGRELTQLAEQAVELGALLRRVGDWFDALRVLERGESLATALGLAHRAFQLRLAIASLSEGLGDFDRARSLLGGLRREARERELRDFDFATSLGLADVALAGDEIDAARLWYDRALEACGQQTASLDVATVELRRAALELRAGDLSAGSEALGAALRGVMSGPSSAEHQARALLVEAQLEMAADEEGAKRAIGRLEEARKRAGADSSVELVAEIEAMLAVAYRDVGATTLAEEAQRRSRKRWERIAATLDRRAHERFWRHPKRRALDDDESAPEVDREVNRFLRDLSERVGPSKTVDEVLRLARRAESLEGELHRVEALLQQREEELAELRGPEEKLAMSREAYEREEARRILVALNERRWNVRAVSRDLGIPSNTLYRRLKKYGISRRPKDQ